MTTNHEEENSVFAAIVKDKNDAVAMIAYCFYKLEKLDYFNQHTDVDDKEKHKICRVLAEGERLERIKRDAREMLSTSLDAALADYCKKIAPKTFGSSVWEGIMAGVIVTFIAPLIWLVFFYIIKASNLWGPFVSLVNSIPHK